jgi:hypothetical protein
MPRDLGKAKRADLTGKFPGEQAEYGSALARFLEGSGQLRPLTEGTYLEASGNGNGHETEIPRGKTETGRSKDTEVGPSPFGGAQDRSGGNGHHFATDTVFDSPLDNAFAEDEMFPEPMMEAELTPGPVEAPASSLTPLAAVSTPIRQPEPQSLDSVPDLLSPELDSLGEESAEEPEDETELLAGRRKPSVPDLPPPEHSEDTGMLIAEAFSTRKEDGWDSMELEGEDEEERKITDKLNRRPEGDEDLTNVLRAESGPHDGEKITSKVEPRRDLDPRTLDPNAVVRDTVNFYNQTQNFQEQRKSAGFPTISPNVVNSGQPLGLRDDQTDRMPRPPREPAAAADDGDDTDTLRPGPALSPMDELSPDEGLVLSPDAEAPMSLDAEPVMGPDEEPALSAAGKLVPGPVAAPLELSAEADIEEADKRETDKFTQEDREPPQLPLPEGTDKVDKTQAPPRRKAKSAAGDVEGLEPLADEKVAAGKDTQRFYVAEILAKKASAGESTAELQPAEEGLPPQADAKGTGETSSDYSTDSAPAPRRRTAARKDETVPLPVPRDVHTDFIEHVHVSASERIIPELPELDEEEADEGDDTVDEEATGREEAIERLPRPVRPSPAVSRRTTSSTSTGHARPVPGAFSERLELERAETLRLIEQAEAVAVRLREASDSSRSDLVALSARRETVRATRAEIPDPAAAETAYDLPEDEIAAAGPVDPIDPMKREIDERETAQIVDRAAPEAPRRVADRVPTRAIGEMVSELQRSAERAPASLSALLDQVSRKAPARGNGNGAETLPHDEDIDLLVAASSRLRETIESAGDEDRISGRMPALGHVEGPAPGRAEAPSPAEASGRRASESSLSGDLDRLWQVLDSRRAAPVSSRTTVEPATLLIPAADKARITARESDVPGLEEGWTQEMLWPTLAGIAVVTFALGAVFVWVLVRAMG